MLKKILRHRDLISQRYPVIAKELFDRLTEQEYDYLLSKLSSFNYRLYNDVGILHGACHVEKVFLYTFLLSKDIEEPYRTILLDASFYHDIGRSKVSDSLHGDVSATILEPYLDEKTNSIYSDIHHRILSRALMSAHCAKDNLEHSLFENAVHYFDLLLPDGEMSSELKLVEQIYMKLISILKDADALDRKRFKEDTYEALDPEFIRNEQAVALIPLAEEINALYYELFKLNYIPIPDEMTKSGNCFHAIGFDFFKIKSILQYGILSQEEMKKHSLIIPRNFNGGNNERWISVVDDSVSALSGLDKTNLAIKEFVKHGISFYCESVTMVSPVESTRVEYAIETGLPYNRSGYIDELYVLNAIPTGNITCIMIPSSYLCVDVRLLRYIYNSFDINIINKRIKYFCEKTGTFYNDPLLQPLNQLLEEYKEIVMSVLQKKINYGYYEKQLDIMAKIDQCIGQMVHRFYCIEMGKNINATLTVLEVFEYELNKSSNIEYEMADDAETIFGEKIIKFNIKNIGEKRKIK